MNNTIKSLVFILVSGFVLTSLSFLIVSAHQPIVCMPLPDGQMEGQLAELETGEQKNRGFPFVFYTEAVPDDCMVDDTCQSINCETLASDADVSSNFDTRFFLTDLLIWGFIAKLGMVLAGRLKGRRA